MKPKTDIRALKARHRLELVMIETGEKFEAGIDQWRGIDTPGLVVDLKSQTWRIERAGQEAQSGDVLEWLKFRYGWAFVMCVRFLERRKPDPVLYQESDKHVASPQKYRISEPEQKGDMWQPEPQDGWQRKALKLVGDDIRKFFFNRSGLEIIRIKHAQPARFLAMEALDIAECDECGHEFDWEKTETRAYLAQYLDYGGEEMPQEEQSLFFLDNENLAGFICEKCKNKRRNWYLALDECIASALHREDIEEEERKKETLRIETVAREGVKRAEWSEEFDAEYLVHRCFPAFSYLVDGNFTDDEIKRAFSRKEFYLFLDDISRGRQEYNNTPDFWIRAVKKYAAM